jgi:hydrogenase 3 maturation protease
MNNPKNKLKNNLKKAKRLAILGVGSRLRADDSSGLLAAEVIQKNIKNRHSGLKVFFGETAPENLTGEIKKFKPTHLIIIDSADIDAKPGTIILLKPGQLQGISFCTHQLPLQILTKYLEKSLKCKIAIIGIQPKTLAFNKPVCAPVKKAVKEIAQAIISLS